MKADPWICFLFYWLPLGKKNEKLNVGFFRSQIRRILKF